MKHRSDTGKPKKNSFLIPLVIILAILIGLFYLCSLALDSYIFSYHPQLIFHYPNQISASVSDWSGNFLGVDSLPNREIEIQTGDTEESIRRYYIDILPRKGWILLPTHQSNSLVSFKKKYAFMTYGADIYFLSSTNGRNKNGNNKIVIEITNYIFKAP